MVCILKGCSVEMTLIYQLKVIYRTINKIKNKYIPAMWRDVRVATHIPRGTGFES